MKRSMKAILLVLMLLLSMSSTALAAEGEKLGAGFCSTSTTVGAVKIEGRTAANGVVNPVSANPVGGGNAVKYYEGAERLRVTYSGDATEGDQFMVLLVTGNKLPTVANSICYIDQVAKADGNVIFDVYPMLPAENTELTLFITSSRAGFTTIAIPLTYAAAGTHEKAPYTLGDANEDGEISAYDAMLVLQYAAELELNEPLNEKAADVNGSGVVDVNDAIKILQYAADLIDSF